MSEVLTVNNLKLYYFTRKGVVKALDDVSFSLKRRNPRASWRIGCGKTTLGMGLTDA